MVQHNLIKTLNYNIFSGDPDSLFQGFTGTINTINPHSYIISKHDEEFKTALMESDVLLADGVGFTLAVRVLNGIRIKRTTGSDIHRILINYLDKKNGSCFYLGSADSTLQKLKERLLKEHPGIKAGFFSPPFKRQYTDEEDLSMIRIINDFNPEILFVGLSAPKQEKWVYKNKYLLNTHIICSVGAVFDFYAGTVKRPGKFWLNTGLEWLPRLLREPKRLWQRSFISAPLFMWYLIKEKTRLIFS